MNRKHQVFLALMTTGLVAGCGSPQINRIDRNREIYESWPVEVKQAVLDGKVEPGMTPEMVVVSWGEPTEKIQRSNSAGDEEIWVYRKGGSDGTMMPMGGPAYPGGMYPGYPGGMYPGGGYPGYPGGISTGPTIGIATGPGGTGIISGGGIGIGNGGITTGMGGMGGMGGPVIMTPPTPPEEREVVFRQGVVYRADAP